MDIFEYRDRYPQAPGFAPTDTSYDAAQEIKPNVAALQAKVLAAIGSAGARGLTTNECAAVTGIDKGSIQPRTTELRLLDKIKDGGARRKNASGKSAIVWRLA